MRRLLILLVAVALSSAPSAQRAGQVDVARIDAIAVDASGRFVRDLKLDDLQVVEGEVAHPITELRLIRAGVTADPAALRPITSQFDEKSEAVSEETRLAGIFLDDYHVSPGPAVARVREVIGRVVETTFAARDLIATVRPLDSLPNIRLSRDRSQVTRALAAFDGRKGDYAARTALERALVASDPVRADGARSQVAISALNALALHLGSMRPGRKTLIVVSEGFAAPPPTRGSGGLPSIESIVRSANRSGVSIYVIDPRALLPDTDVRRPSNDESRQVQMLRTMADETDGVAILTPSDVTAGLTRLSRDTAEYYLIGFQPQKSQRGRQESVELRSRRADVLLRARTVYFLPLLPPEPPAPRVRPPVPVADQMRRRISPMIRTWFGFERAPDGKTRVLFTWQPGARLPGSGANPIVPALVTMRVLNPDGSVRVEQLLGPVGSADGLATQATFDIAAGRTVIQTSVQNEERQVLDTDLRDLTVPAFERDVLAFGTPQVLRAATDEQLRRVAADMTATPVVTREFVPTDRLLVRVPVYGAVAASPSGRLFSSSGAMLRSLEVNAVAGTALWQATVSLADLSGGSYYVELAAVSGTEARQEKITFGVIH